jgi:integrase
MKADEAELKYEDPKPIEVKKGSVRVKIYQGTKRFTKNGKTYTYPQYSLCYYNGGRRVRKRFPSLPKATKAAKDAADKLAKGQHEVLQLSSADAAIYVQARNLLKPLRIPLNVAVAEFVSARKSLPDGATLSEATKFFAQRNPAALEKRTIEEVVDELLKAKAGANRSQLHVKDLEGRLKQFSKAFPNYMIAGVTGGMIQQYIDDLDLSARSKWNHLRHIGALFRFGIKRKYLAKESIDEVEAVEMPDFAEGEIHVFTPIEMNEVLTVAWPGLVPWLAIGAFAGLRSAELARLDWSEVNLQERHITVAADKAKTGARRVVPISENLSAWLQPYTRPHGEIMTYVNWWNELAKLPDEINSTRKAAKKKANFRWHRNALRHSFCSYRLAVTGDVARVSYEAGNSPQMIHRHYKALVNEKQGKEWFGIMPDHQAGIIPMPMPEQAAVP